MFDKKKPKTTNTEGQSSDHQSGRTAPSSTEPRRQSVDTGISPTYYHDGDAVTTSCQETSSCSPVYGDANRVFYTHHKSCICMGSGVGCQCSSVCNC
ncbi:hypothetical protein BCR42DRAFT_400067 [Absidia repens]|uniref:Uncharacterized protein n=1 Tax=Absidia repens TaxID=90262 RepID=A0A1X2J0N9_9FUNG|nr:hypothetical protein BCR42DRAFT_400067 [Absidia repens]